MLVDDRRTIYRQAIGILMLDTIFPRIVGDIGNASTFPFPVRYKVVRSATPLRVVEENDDRLLEKFIDSARELEAEGVVAITTSCGFLAIYQQELAATVSIPVFMSSLLQVPLVEKLLAPAREIVIVTANRTQLLSRNLTGVGILDRKYPIVGLEDKVEFYSTFVLQKPILDLEKLMGEMEEAANEVKNNFPNAGAVVMECTNLPPFRHIFRQVTGLPVFDITMLAEYIYAGITAGIFAGIKQL